MYGDEFSYKLFKGNVFKELVKALLEDFGYTTAPYGYENQFSTLIKKELSMNNSETARRIRSSPDLLVYDPDNKDINLVEVKMSAKEYININKIEDYRKFWDDAIIVAVIYDDKDLFYAERIRDLRTLSYRKYHTPKDDFRRIQEVFTKIASEGLDKYRKLAHNMLEATRVRQDDENGDQE
jgi:hypothetical protein